MKKFKLKSPATILLFTSAEYESSHGLADLKLSFTDSHKLRDYVTELVDEESDSMNRLNSMFGSEGRSSLTSECLSKFDCISIVLSYLDNDVNIIKHESICIDYVYSYCEDSDLVMSKEDTVEELYSRLLKAINFDRLVELDLLES